MKVIANNISTRNRSITEALRARAAETVNPKIAGRISQERAKVLQDMAKRCLAAGADILEVNLQQRYDQPEVMRFAVDKIQEVVDVQLCLSSNKAETLEAGLQICRRPPLVNYVSLEEEKLTRILPLVARYNAEVILLPTNL